MSRCREPSGTGPAWLAGPTSILQQALILWFSKGQPNEKITLVEKKLLVGYLVCLVRKGDVLGLAFPGQKFSQGPKAAASQGAPALLEAGRVGTPHLSRVRRN